jgi:hypothetical protein
MRLLFVADGRSPTALSWLAGVIQRGHEVHLVSTFACQPGLPLASLHFLPVAFSNLKDRASPGPRAREVRKGSLAGASLVRSRMLLRQWLGPLTLPRAGTELRKLVDTLQPDLVHAMRIPYEGMAAAQALEGCGPPLLVSAWGNDFTLHAPSNPWMRHATQRTLQVASAFLADCRRDVRLACAWGFDPRKPAIVLPGGGGIQMDLFHLSETNSLDKQPVKVINPRGVRAYICNRAFFRSIPKVLELFPEVRFVCPSMAGENQVEGWVKMLGIQPNVELYPAVTRAEMADLFQHSQVVVSPSIHDGTPNSLLEAMACGCFPVAGDLESIREWITPGVNGWLVDPRDESSLAEGMIRALENGILRARAASINRQKILSRAEFQAVMEELDRFYKSI